jgi:hypothetical protein
MKLETGNWKLEILVRLFAAIRHYECSEDSAVWKRAGEVAADSREILR